MLRSSSATIQNNLIRDNSSGGSIGAATGQVLISNNTFVNNGVSAINVVTGSSASVTFANNISAFHDQEPQITEVLNKTIIRNNCVFDGFRRSFPIGRNGNIAAYPEFTDLWQGDYRLLPESPCVDSGDDTYVAAGDLDLDGNLRLMGAHVDMGAYESPWIGVGTSKDTAAALLRIVGGLSPAPPATSTEPDTRGPTGLDITDVLRLLR